MQAIAMFADAIYVFGDSLPLLSITAASSSPISNCAFQQLKRFDAIAVRIVLSTFSK